MGRLEVTLGFYYSFEILLKGFVQTLRIQLNTILLASLYKDLFYSLTLCYSLNLAAELFAMVFLPIYSMEASAKDAISETEHTVENDSSSCVDDANRRDSVENDPYHYTKRVNSPLNYTKFVLRTFLIM